MTAGKEKKKTSKGKPFLFIKLILDSDWSLGALICLQVLRTIQQIIEWTKKWSKHTHSSLRDTPLPPWSVADLDRCSRILFHPRKISTVNLKAVSRADQRNPGWILQQKSNEPSSQQ